MQRADRLFQIEERVPDSAFVDRLWRARSVPSEAFISVAATHWEIVIWRQAGVTQVTLRGAETRATAMPIPVDAEFFGIQFKRGAFMPDLAMPALVDRTMSITARGSNTLHLGGSCWDIPDYDNAETFLAQLARAQLIAFDPIVVEAAMNRSTGLSRRSVERRVRRATGLTSGAIRQIDRAQRATALLEAGADIAEVVTEAGYADQAHLTRSLKRFIGQTPGRLLKEAR
jgi:AraC-like DNA-binding protein